MAIKAPRSFAFVPADDFGRIEVTHRKLIRSHCMREKNKKKGVRIVVPPSELGAGHVVPQATVQFPLLPLLDLVRSDAQVYGKQGPGGRDGPEVMQEEAKLPRPPPPDLSLVRFAGEVDYHSRELLFKFFNMARNMAYPAGLCVDFDFNKITWFQWLTTDVAYLHSVLLGTSALNDFILQRTPTRTTYIHLKSTIAFLNKHLSDSVISLQDSTVAVVITLAMLADVLGDYSTVRTHMAGLQRMIRLRGGLQGFCNNSKLHIKICHLDLSFSLNTGKPPRLFTDPVSWVPMFDRIPPTPNASAASSRMQCIVNPLLAIAFHDVQYFAELMNAATADPSRRLRDTEFQTFVHLTQYRLLQLQDTLTEPLDELLRLALLAFLASITLHFPETKTGGIQYPYLARRFRECYCRSAADLDFENLTLWLLTMIAMAVHGVNDPWLRQCWRVEVSSDLSWTRARLRLEEIMWIRAIHDRAGRYAFEVMQGHQKVH